MSLTMHHTVPLLFPPRVISLQPSQSPRRNSLAASNQSDVSALSTTHYSVPSALDHSLFLPLRSRPLTRNSSTSPLWAQWTALPKFLRKLSQSLHKATGKHLPISATPVTFGSWMGGDRDGNPNVTAEVTKQVIYLARWIAADLYLKEIEILRFELSMSSCSDELAAMADAISVKNKVQSVAGNRGSNWTRCGVCTYILFRRLQSS